MGAQGEIRDGMTVYSADREKLGKVVRCSSTSFVIEKGFFFPKDYLARYEDVSRVSEDEVWLLVNASEIQDSSDAIADMGSRGVDEPATSTTRTDETVIGTDMGARGVAMPEASAASAGLTDESLRASRAETGGFAERDISAGRNVEAAIPLAEEELIPEKRTQKAGDVRVRKEVVTEERQVTVPVTREEVHVERTPVNREAAPGEAAFQEAETVVPVYEEEVEVRKRPVVREEVRIGKTAYEEQRTASGTVRREEIDVDDEETRRAGRRDDDPETKR